MAKVDGDHVCGVCGSEFNDESNVVIHGERTMCIVCAGNIMEEHRAKAKDMLDNLGSDPESFRVVDGVLDALEEALDNWRAL